MNKVSYYNGVRDVNSRMTASIDALFECIRVGGKDGRIKAMVSDIRSETDNNRRLKKSSLPVIMWQGIFHSRNNTGISSLSGLMCIDIDHKGPQELAQLRIALSSEPWVLSFFTSPSGDGMKVIVRTDNYDIGLYKNLYKQLEKLFENKYGASPDKNCEPLSQGCYASYDPDIYVNFNALPMHLEYDKKFDDNGKKSPNKPPTQVTIKPTQSPTVNKFLNNMGQMSDEELLEVLDWKFMRNPIYYTDGHRTKTIYIQASELCMAGIPYDMALPYLKSHFLPTGYDENKLEHEVYNAYSKNADYFSTKRHTYYPLNY